MPVIGTFTAIKDGYAGTIRTLNLNSKVEILANDRSEGEGAPQYRILVGATEIGVAWRKTKRGSGENHLSVLIEESCLAPPILAVLLEATGSGSARLLWRRNRKGS